jgi:hypothetical protein
MMAKNRKKERKKRKYGPLLSLRARERFSPFAGEAELDQKKSPRGKGGACWCDDDNNHVWR